jgi:hypothetical protein
MTYDLMLFLALAGGFTVCTGGMVGSVGLPVGDLEKAGCGRSAQTGAC